MGSEKIVFFLFLVEGKGGLERVTFGGGGIMVVVLVGFFVWFVCGFGALL